MLMPRNHGFYQGLTRVVSMSGTTKQSILSISSLCPIQKYLCTRPFFIPGTELIAVGADCVFVRVYSYATWKKIKDFEAHNDQIRCLAVHKNSSYMLSVSDDGMIKLWDWKHNWALKRKISGHAQSVRSAVFDPTESHLFATSSMDLTVKIWNVNSEAPISTFNGHNNCINSAHYLTSDKENFLVTGSDDCTAKVWDVQGKNCVHTFEHTKRVSVVCYLPDPHVIITGSEDGSLFLWDSQSFRLLKELKYGLKKACVAKHIAPYRIVAIGYEEGIVIIEVDREHPKATIDNSGNIIWVKNGMIQTVNVENIEMSNGKMKNAALKTLGSCELFPQMLKVSPNERQLAVYGEGRYIIYGLPSLKTQSCGTALSFAYSSKGEYAIRRNVEIKIFNKTHQETKRIPTVPSATGMFGGIFLSVCWSKLMHLYDWSTCKLVHKFDADVRDVHWAQTVQMVAIASEAQLCILKYNKGSNCTFELLHEGNERIETGLWGGDCYIYINSQWSLKSCVAGKVTMIYPMNPPMYHLRRSMNVLGYDVKRSQVYLIDKDLKIVRFVMNRNLMEFMARLLCGSKLDEAASLLHSVPKINYNIVVDFLKSRGIVSAIEGEKMVTEVGQGLTIVKENLRIEEVSSLHEETVSNIRCSRGDPID